MKKYAWINRIKKLKVPGKVKRNSGPKIALNGDNDVGAGHDNGMEAVEETMETMETACAKNPTCSGHGRDEGRYGGGGGKV